MIMHFLNYNALTMHDHSILSNLEEQTHSDGASQLPPMRPVRDVELYAMQNRLMAMFMSDHMCSWPFTADHSISQWFIVVHMCSC